MENSSPRREPNLNENYSSVDEVRPKRKNLKVIILSTIAVVSVLVASLVIYIFNKDKEIARLQDQTTVSAPEENQDTSVVRTYPTYTNPGYNTAPMTEQGPTGNYYTAKPHQDTRKNYSSYDTGYYQNNFSNEVESQENFSSASNPDIRVNSSTAALDNSAVSDSSLRINSSMDAEKNIDNLNSNGKKKGKYKDKNGVKVYREKTEVKDGHVNEVPVDESNEANSEEK